MTDQRGYRTHIPTLLKARGHSVRWFCRQAGISTALFYRMELGERALTANYLVRASNILNVPVNMLLTEMSDSLTEAVAA